MRERENKRGREREQQRERIREENEQQIKKDKKKGEIKNLRERRKRWSERKKEERRL